MKKIISLLLVLSMVLSFAMVASAAEGDVVYEDNTTPTQPAEDGNYVDITQVQLKKTYTSVGENAVNPAEDFEYTITLKSYSDSGYTQESDIPLPYFDNTADQTGIISYTEGEATAEGDVNTVLINLPVYEYVGIYTYEIKETKGDTMGVTYDENSLFLKVTVIEQDGKVRVAALHYETEAGSKTEGFKNIYSADDLTVKKIVTGNLGDQTKDFSFNVKFNVPAEYNYIESTVELWVNGAYVRDLEGIIDNYNLNLTLRHGQTFEIRNLPYGVTYTVTEADYSGEGYDTPSIVGDDETVTALATTGKIEAATDADPDAKDEIVVTNNKDEVVDTGISLDSIPYILMLVVAAVGAVAVIGKKRYEV